MKAGTGWTIVAAIVVANAVVAYYWLREPDEAPVAVAPDTRPPPAPVSRGEPGTMPPIRYPVEAIDPAAEPAEASSLPALEESDAAIRASLGELFADAGPPQMLVLRDIIRRVVVTVDNLPREQLARRLSPLEPAEGALLVSGRGDTLAISEHNRGRYAPYVILAESVDLDYLVALYVRFYPLFQQAFRELGYPEGYFNDRLVAVIDHLLDTPEPEGPIRLVQPKVLYQFADPDLERRSVGQKFLLRAGPENAARIKARLREVRQRVAGAPPGG